MQLSVLLARRWFEALEQRDTYTATQSDFYTHCWDIPPQYGPPHAAPGTQAFADAIDGQDGKSWHLPLPPLNAQSFEPRSNVHDDGNVRSPSFAAGHAACAGARLGDGTVHASPYAHML